MVTPKSMTGKTRFLFLTIPLWLGYKPSHDAYITMTWGSYYYAAIGVCLARLTADIYLKTALIRLPFVIAGLAGLMIFAFTMRRFFRKQGFIQVIPGSIYYMRNAFG